MSTVGVIIEFRQATDQMQVCFIQSVDIWGHADPMEISNLANESWEDFKASVPKFAIPQ